jgi:hypothetical protein
MSFEDQTARIEGLISLISSTNSGTADELAERFGRFAPDYFQRPRISEGTGFKNPI